MSIKIKINAKLLKLLDNKCIMEHIKDLCQIEIDASHIELIGKNSELISDILHFAEHNFPTKDITIEEFKALASKFSKEKRSKQKMPKNIHPKSEEQREYISMIMQNDITFGFGPAGTGKTHLAIAMAIDALLNRQTSKIILSRPIIEAGERLGYLPGGIKEKTDPYLRPLYDEILLWIDQIYLNALIEANTIEIAPIAYMRGRTFRDAWVIIDEAQNMSVMQMKLLLTRIGEKSKFIITGDNSQVDTSYKNWHSGLSDAINRLQNIPGIAFMQFSQSSIVRHHLVQRIVQAYQKD